MGHRTTHKPGRMKKESGAPSTAFIIMAILGLAFLIWMAYTIGSKPQKPALGALSPPVSATAAV